MDERLIKLDPSETASGFPAPSGPMTHADLLAENARLRAALKSDWDDKPDDMTEEIERTHPFKVKDWARYQRAQELVSNRHSKGALIDLVAYLLLSKGADNG